MKDSDIDLHAYTYAGGRMVVLDCGDNTSFVITHTAARKLAWELSRAADVVFFSSAATKDAE